MVDHARPELAGAGRLRRCGQSEGVGACDVVPLRLRGEAVGVDRLERAVRLHAGPGRVGRDEEVRLGLAPRARRRERALDPERAERMELRPLPGRLPLRAVPDPGAGELDAVAGLGPGERRERGRIARDQEALRARGEQERRGGVRGDAEVEVRRRRDAADDTGQRLRLRRPVHVDERRHETLGERRGIAGTAVEGRLRDRARAVGRGCAGRDGEGEADDERPLHSGGRTSGSPFLGQCASARSACAVIVSDGLTPRFALTAEPSTMCRPGSEKTRW